MPEWLDTQLAQVALDFLSLVMTAGKSILVLIIILGFLYAIPSVKHTIFPYSDEIDDLVERWKRNRQLVESGSEVPTNQVLTDREVEFCKSLASLTGRTAIGVLILASALVLTAS